MAYRLAVVGHVPQLRSRSVSHLSISAGGTVGHVKGREVGQSSGPKWCFLNPLDRLKAETTLVGREGDLVFVAG